jgi:23S rRNA (adenine2503-C2)-methyltransferase
MIAAPCAYRHKRVVRWTAPFCSTGKQGFNRNLTVAEIIGQLWQANQVSRCADPRRRTAVIISNVVLMGMGEPLANFENYSDCVAPDARRQRLRIVAAPRDRIHFRTGAGRWIACATNVPVALAVSLHAPNDALAR